MSSQRKPNRRRKQGNNYAQYLDFGVIMTLLGFVLLGYGVLTLAGIDVMALLNDGGGGNR